MEEIAEKNDLEVVNKDSTVAVNRAFLDGDVPVYRIDGPAVVMVSSKVSVLSSRGEYVVGIGCNRGTASGEIEQAVQEAMHRRLRPAAHDAQHLDGRVVAHYLDRKSVV